MEDCQLLYFRLSDEVKIILRYMYFISVHMNNDPFNTNIDNMYNSLQNKKQNKNKRTHRTLFLIIPNTNVNYCACILSPCPLNG